jgi:hypothetical protein
MSPLMTKDDKIGTITCIKQDTTDIIVKIESPKREIIK